MSGSTRRVRPPAPARERSAPRRRVVVAGAGAAGISAAFRLHRAGFDVEVLEAGSTVGGRAETVLCNGFRFDTGAGALPSTYDAVLRLVDALGIRDEVQPRGAVIGALRDGEVHRIARRNPLTFLSAKNIPAKDKASLWRLGTDLARMFRTLNYVDLGSSARFDTRSIHDYCAAGYPDSVRENLLEPITRALLLTEPEHNSVVDLFAACASLLVAGHILTHPEGIGFFLHRAANHLNVRYGARVDEVREGAHGVDIRWSGAKGTQWTDADAVVLALPAAATVAAHPLLDPVQCEFLENLEYSTSIVVSLGVTPAPEESSSMVLFPRDVEPELAAVGLGHNLAPGRAPAGGGVLTAYWMSEYSERNFAASDDELVAATRARINAVLPGWADNVLASHVARWRPALVASRVGTYAGLADFHARTDPSSLVQLAGDYHAQTSVNASVAAGERAARQLLTTLPVR